MDEKQKRAVAALELLDLIKHCRATRRAFEMLMVSMDPADFEGSELKDLANGINAVEELEAGAQKGLEKLRKPKGEP